MYGTRLVSEKGGYNFSDAFDGHSCHECQDRNEANLNIPCMFCKLCHLHTAISLVASVLLLDGPNDRSLEKASSLPTIMHEILLE